MTQTGYIVDEFSPDLVGRIVAPTGILRKLILNFTLL